MLSLEDYIRIGEKNRKCMAEIKEKCAEVRRQELKKQGIIVEEKKDKKDRFHGDCDSPYTMENIPATILYIIVMIAGAIFYDRIYIWIGATAAWLLHITKHLRK